MGIGLIAVAGVLLLGAGVMILVSTLGKTRRVVGDDRPDPDVRLRRGGYGRLGIRVRREAPDRLGRRTDRRLGRPT